MSMFRNISTCEDVLFYSHHIDPVDPNVDGVLTIANGHTANRSLPDQKYNFVVDATTQQLDITTQASGPSPLVNCLSLLPAGGLDVGNNRIQNLATPELASDAATKAYVDAGGGVATHASKISNAVASKNVNSTVTATSLFAIAPTGAAIDTATIFDLDIMSLTGSFSTASVNPIAIEFYLSDSATAVPNVTGKRFGSYSLNIGTASGTFSVSNLRLSWYGPLTSYLYLNAILTTQTQGALLTSINLLGQVRAVPATLNSMSNVVVVT